MTGPEFGTKDTKPSVLITGVAGVLGLALAAECGTMGIAVRGLSRSAGEADSLDALKATLLGSEVLIGDLNDREFTSAACADASEIVHLAGRSGVAASFEDPVGHLVGSVNPLVNIIRAAPQGARLMLVSSQLVYGVGRSSVCRETDPPSPDSPYAAHQALLETYGRLFSTVRNLEVVVLRLGNVFGDAYRLDRPRAHGVVPRMLRDVVECGEARIFGGGDQTLDLLHVSDFARSILAVMATPIRPGNFSLYNVAGEEITVGELASLLVEGVGRGLVRAVPWPLGSGGAMAQNLTLDDFRFRTTFGWKPESSIREKLVNLGRRWAGE